MGSFISPHAVPVPMNDLALHVGIEHPSAVWLLGAIVLGFGLGYLHRLFTRDETGAPDSAEDPSAKE